MPLAVSSISQSEPYGVSFEPRTSFIPENVEVQKIAPIDSQPKILYPKGR